MQWLETKQIHGIIDLTPGIRSLQIHYDSRSLPLSDLMDTLLHAEGEVPDLDAIEAPTRIVHLPLCWEDPSTRLAIEKYKQTVRPDASWCPSNIEYLRRINGLGSVEDVKRAVFDASYLVLGLGDAFPGAPVTTPLDPRHRLATGKCKPARAWTPQNAVGLCDGTMRIHGMEGPGDDQLVGRTVQIWNTYRVTQDFEAGKPWLLRFFDQIRFYPVSARQLQRHREDFATGKFRLRTEEQTFKLKDYEAFLARNSKAIEAFRSDQRAAFAGERERWAAEEKDIVAAEPVGDAPASDIEMPPGSRLIRAHLPGSVWQAAVKEGETVQAGDKLVILESMKMQTAIHAPVGGLVERVLVAPGAMVEAGQAVAVLVEREAE
jgi:urea carboxylase